MRVSILLRSVATIGLATVSLVGCDQNLIAPQIPNLKPALAIAADSVIPIQGSIRILFNEPVNRQTALDPGNFVVVNTCNGLPVPGSLRFNGDTLIFTPSQTLPYLTGLTVRIQGVLDQNNNAMTQPVIIPLRTQNPPVSDVSWQALTSPTNDFVAGVSFLDTQTGFISTITGGVYRTVDGGNSFSALFKSADITGTRDIRVVSKDSLYMVGSPSFGGSTVSATALFR